jgi:glucose/arabinose dehydrogenase
VRPRGAAAVAFLLVGLAACGSDDPGAETGATSPVVAISPSPTTGAPTTAPPASDATEPGSTPAPPTTTPVALNDVQVSLDDVGSFDQPIALVARPGHPDLLYVAERPGRVRAVGDGVDDVVLDITGNTTTDAERGLLGLAFSPSGDFLYVSYTDDDGTSTIDEYGVVDDGTVDTNSKRRILTQDQPYANHNGGHIIFGPDGYLYFGLGDGGAADDPDRNGLDLDTWLGKLLRIDPSQPDGDQPYSIPTDNPYVTVAGARPEIWSSGLRNPWRFSFDRATGDLWIGDVGQNQWEEVDLAPATDGAGKAADFGWSAWEATHRFNEDQDAPDHVPPIAEYEHGSEGCSITGGFVYRGTAVPALTGVYVFGDYCSGKIWGLRFAADGSIERAELASLPTLVSFGEDLDGELYAVSLDGSVVRFSPG